MLNDIHIFFNAFEAAVIVPIMIFITALFLKVKSKKAMMCGFYVGIGLTGFLWIINGSTPVVTKIVRQMVNNIGIKLPVIDIDWQVDSLASFGSPVGLIFSVFGLVVEFILFAVEVTKVFMLSNLWNNFGFMIWGTLAFYVTYNWWISPGLSFFTLLYILLLAEVQVGRWSSHYKIENTIVCVAQNVVQAVPVILLDPLWDLLGLNKANLTPAAFRDKFGIFGEPTTLGATLGIVIGILGNIKDLTTIKAWGQVLQFAVQLSAVMTISPLVTNIFNKAFTPLAKQTDKERKQSKNQDSEIDLIHDKKCWFLATDDDVGYGEPATIISGIILIPIMVVIAFLLSGSRTLPVVDLISLPFMVEPIAVITGGNILKVTANEIVWSSLGLYAANWLGSIYTRAISQYGATIPVGIVLVISFNLMARPLNASASAALISRNPLWTSLCIIVYLALLFTLRKYRPQIWTYLNKIAIKNVHASQDSKPSPKG